MKNNGRKNEDSTIVFTDINKALRSSDAEAEEKNACLLGIGGELNGAILELPHSHITLGRSPSNTYILEFQGISREHLKLEISEKEVTLIDLGSRNGTYVNNKRVHKRTVLNKGDVIKIGVIALKFIPRGDPERLTYDKLNHSANTDALTDCYNKAYFNQVCNLAVKKCKVTGDPLCLTIFDIDYFKKINDSYGHNAGDKVLKELAQLIKRDGVRKDDTFARYGGEEFVILLPKTNLKQGYQISERIRILTEEKEFQYEGKGLSLTISAGVADYRPGVQTGTDLFKRADKAVYESKKGGRNQVNFYRE